VDLTNPITQLRLQDIKRWHIVPMMCQQTVADHTYGVIILARAICVIVINEIPIIDCKVWGQERFKECERQVVLAALEHDFNEIGMGDIPTKDTTLQEFEAKWKKKDLVDKIVSLADMMEAMFTLQRLCPTAHGRHIEIVLMAKILCGTESMTDNPKINGNISGAILSLIGAPKDYSCGR
jgi:hypothetical protein